ncbi:uncharacterized protein FRV6_06957 [Fusarium oxysporum]|uniref:Uncharacterized protein n=1 Tax=Fusarium oxysporum TaxID=5507 RepID=A0A2H3TDL7_FUSOX|nr:uncharacterized protein FRV6_06957 [Fusarium oxysporum]
MRKIVTPPTYADVVRAPPDSPASSIVQTSASGGTAPSNMSKALFCTIDVSRAQTDDSSRVIPSEIRPSVQNEITPQRIRIVCLDEDEQQTIKRLLENNYRRAFEFYEKNTTRLKLMELVARPYWTTVVGAARIKTDSL